MNRTWLECECTTPEHAVRITLHKHGPASTDLELTIEPRLLVARQGFFRRLYWAISILLGRNVDLFAECILSDESINKLSTMISSYRLLTKLRVAKESGRSSR